MSADGFPVAGGVERTVLVRWLAEELRVTHFRDYCPNGLQVAGRERIRRIITGVTASQALLEAAIARQADAVLVHHGWFWKSDDPCVVGPMRNRLALALRHDLNLLAYHLPLDAHPIWGNNAQLGRVLGLVPDAHPAAKPDSAAFVPYTVGNEGLLWVGSASGVRTLGQLADRVEQRLQRPPLVIGDPAMTIEKIVWCTGGAQGYMSQAIDAGASVYLTGEASEYNTHLARETGTGFVAAGHHATERYGVQALGQAVAERFGIDVEFIEIDNPV